MGLRLLTKSSPLAGTFFYNASIRTVKDIRQSHMEFVSNEDRGPMDHVLNNIDRETDCCTSVREAASSVIESGALSNTCYVQRYHDPHNRKPRLKRRGLSMA